MTTPSHAYREWDAAYVLGALSPAQRREFEEHLAGCPTCQAAISELAGMPGLLAQVPPEDVEVLMAATPDPVTDHPPDTLVPHVIHLAGRQRRRLVGWVAAAAAALVIVLGGLAVGSGLVPLGPQGPERLGFSAVVPTAITAVVDLVPAQDGGTDVKVECQYGEVNEPNHGGYAEYSVVVVGRSGQTQLIKQWPAKPNKVMRPGGHTALRISQIDQVQIRDTASDEVLLRAPVR